MFIKILPIVFDKSLEIFKPEKYVDGYSPGMIVRFVNCIFTQKGPAGERGFYGSYWTYKTLNENDLTQYKRPVFVNTDHISNYKCGWLYSNDDEKPTSKKTVTLSLSSGDKVEFFPEDQPEEVHIDLNKHNISWIKND